MVRMKLTSSETRRQPLCTREQEPWRPERLLGCMQRRNDILQQTTLVYLLWPVQQHLWAASQRLQERRYGHVLGRAQLVQDRRNQGYAG